MISLVDFNHFLFFEKCRKGLKEEGPLTCTFRIGIILCGFALKNHK